MITEYPCKDLLKAARKKIKIKFFLTHYLWYIGIIFVICRSLRCVAC